ncbi:hypothetical protein [Nisaea sp.]|uniref:hypothetical protein n=1 Tax=Nisaea sp. TaxID=2024842 RepID=UPI0032EC097D
MIFEIRERPDGKFVECACGGTVTSASVADAITEMRKVDGYADGLNSLWDFREADLSELSVGEMKTILEFMEQTPKRRSARIALLAAKKPDLLLLELWRVVSADRYGQSTVLFPDYDEACLWLAASD